MSATEPTVLILANGEPPSRELLRRWTHAVDWFVCTDGALAVALAAEVRPDTVLGDFDSLREPPPEGVEALHLGEQETTDLEKAFYTALERGMRRAVVLGAGGRRWDQFFGNLSIFARYAGRLAIEAEDDRSWLRLLPPGEPSAVDAPMGTIVSLLPLPRAVGVTIEGFRWPLTDATLALGDRDGISNEIIESPARVVYVEGCLAAYGLKESGPD